MTRTSPAGTVGHAPRRATSRLPLVLVTQESDAATLAARVSHIARAGNASLVHVLYLHPLPKLAEWDPNVLTTIWAAMEMPAQCIYEEMKKSLHELALDTRLFCYPGAPIYRIADHAGRHPISDLVFAKHGRTRGWRSLKFWSSDLDEHQLQMLVPKIALCPVPISTEV